MGSKPIFIAALIPLRGRMASLSIAPSIRRLRGTSASLAVRPLCISWTHSHRGRSSTLIPTQTSSSPTLQRRHTHTHTHTQGRKEWGRVGKLMLSRIHCRSDGLLVAVEFYKISFKTGRNRILSEKHQRDHGGIAHLSELERQVLNKSGGMYSNGVHIFLNKFFGILYTSFVIMFVYCRRKHISAKPAILRMYHKVGSDIFLYLFSYSPYQELFK
jgi:hypothetical protein